MSRVTRLTMTERQDNNSILDGRAPQSTLLSSQRSYGIVPSVEECRKGTACWLQAVQSLGRRRRLAWLCATLSAAEQKQGSRIKSIGSARTEPSCRVQARMSMNAVFLVGLLFFLFQYL